MARVAAFFGVVSGHPPTVHAHGILDEQRSVATT
jgi:hypothetical protein